MTGLVERVAAYATQLTPVLSNSDEVFYSREQP